ncbi:MAG TPA: tRNA (adenosine(37)-N6)-threonylcarbamoyltransferase complex transferase subunit TsaD [Candidatus Corynebacterium avicola]|uniref:tRNA N6-adenosine threonylcarbamoyltransferase n=1 Tax=Candidatus Corynebacterium avicola TaxID=2838527 RepID=A0A9D1RPJ3_9CORY|nr:tRNA (adenosine(37)-N6)-threonylcarbamoyltransferase complex transferase subunit TsaD [Candidatus Corynebacterium avicola]
MHVLAVDTSTSFVVAGVVELPADETPVLLSETTELNPRGHMEVLTPNILDALSTAGLSPDDLDAVVVGTGPGPFTGLRVGMATGAAFGDALGVPVHGVPSHAATAAAHDIDDTADHPVLVLSDARRREWYVTAVPGESTVAPPAEIIAAQPEAQVLASRETATAADDVPGWEILDADARPTPIGLVKAALSLRGGVTGLTGQGEPLRALYLRRPDAVEPKAKPVSGALDFSNVTQDRATVGPLSPGAAARCAEIEAELFAGDSPWPVNGFTSEIAAPNTAYLGLVTGAGTDNEELVGYAGLAKNGPSDGPEFEIHTIGVDVAHQGRGWSRLLMDPMMELADADDGPVFLEVRTDNEPAIGLYRSYGFEVVGTRRNYYRPSGADAYTMVRPARSARQAAAEENKPQLPEQTADRPVVVMGVESSCDETGVGLVELHADGTVTQVSNRVASSMEQHARFGGVVPEIASRAHLEAMGPTMRAALGDLSGKTGRERPDAVAATVGPGLAGALLVGAAAAKAYAAAWGVPFYGVNHLGGHVAVGTLGSADDLGHAIALLVSGGHTQILEVNGVGRPMKELGSTLDDAAGEAYDKVARLLGLGYPGGPVIDRLAAQGDPTAVKFPRGLSRAHDPAYDFSFSGLKTAVARFVETTERQGGTVPVEDVCASFQEAVVDVLTAKSVAACTDTGATTLLLGGGVSANRRLRALAEERCAAAGVTLIVPALPLCTDNGVMMATLAARLIAAGATASPLTVATDPSMDVEVPLLADAAVEG